MMTTLTRTSSVPSDASTLRVVIADGLTLSRITLRTLLARNGGCAIVGETFDGGGAVKLVREQRPHPSASPEVVLKPSAERGVALAVIARASRARSPGGATRRPCPARRSAPPPGSARSPPCRAAPH
jgi:hypothetical protein